MIGRSWPRHVSKLTAADVRAIRASGLSQRALADRYGITIGQVNKIVRKKSWKKLPRTGT